MTSISEHIERIKSLLWGVKIVRHHSYKGTHASAVRETVYYNKGFSFEELSKWKWYFEYRKALAKIETPIYHIEATYFKYKAETKEERDKKKKRKLASLRGQVTKQKRKVEKIESDISKHVQWYKNTQIQFVKVEDTEPYKKAKAILFKEQQKLIDKEQALLEANRP